MGSSPDSSTTDRRRQARSDVRRAQLVDAAVREFAAHGFDATSTRAIAKAAGTQQPQINYHFDSKESLWRAAVDHLFERVDEVIQRRTEATPEPANDREAFAQQVDAFVRSMAEFPELNRMMVHESTVDSDRLRWIVEHYTKPRFETITSTWRSFRQSGTVRGIDEFVLHYLLIGAASLPYVSAAEAALLGQDTTDSSFIDAHVAALVEMLLAPEGP